MAKNDNLADYLADIADAIRAKKGTEEPINAQDFATEIASIEGGGENIRVSYLRRNGVGYIDTGVKGANSNLQITAKYSFNVFPSGYWSMIHAYKNESTNATRLLFSKQQTVLANINSLASDSVTTRNVTLYKDIIYTSVIYSTVSDICLRQDGVTTLKTISKGEGLGDVNISLFPQTPDGVVVDIYSLQIADLGVIIRDYVPHFKDGKYGLYDLVTKQFYTNSGGGEFSGEIITLE